MTTTLLALSLGTGLAHADIYRVTVRGVVEFNGFTTGALAGIPAGSPAVTQFDVDSAVFLDSTALPGRVRAYDIIPSTFSFTMGNTRVALRSGFAARFGIRNNDPRADGFFLTQGLENPTLLPLDIGTAQTHGVTFSRTFGSIPPVGNDPTLQSLNIAGAVGFWQMENLSVFDYSVQRNEVVVPVVLDYQSLRITRVCGPSDVAGTGQTAGADGELTADDVIVFISWFVAGDARADVGRAGQLPGRDGELTADDVIVFIAAFTAAC